MLCTCKYNFLFQQSYRMYTKALELYPQHSSINLKYAGFLRHMRRDIPGAEKYYLKAVEASPTNSDALGSYASFMHGVHNNIKEAEKYYQKAVEADDMHTNNLCNYGLFLRYSSEPAFQPCIHKVNSSLENTLLLPLFFTVKRKRTTSWRRRCTRKSLLCLRMFSLLYL